MDYFSIIEGATVILACKGVYRQAKIYSRGDEIYAAYGSGFIKLLGMKTTSNPNTKWIDIDCPDLEYERSQPYYRPKNASKPKKNKAGV